MNSEDPSDDPPAFGGDLSASCPALPSSPHSPGFGYLDSGSSPFPFRVTEYRSGIDVAQRSSGDDPYVRIRPQINGPPDRGDAMAARPASGQ